MSSTYNPNVPTGSVPLNQDYRNLQLNFQQANTSFGIDHLTFSNNTAQNGYHTVIHSVPFSTFNVPSNPNNNPPNNQPVLAPASIGGYGQIFTAQINDGINPDEALYYETGGGRVMQLTRNFLPTLAQNGATFLPGGLILNWGYSAVSPINTPTTITYTQPYAADATVYSVLITPITTSASPNNNNVFVQTGTVTKTNFKVVNSSTSSIAFIYWMAIGS